MTPRFRFHRPHFDWLADLGLLAALAAMVMVAAVACSFVPWS